MGQKYSLAHLTVLGCPPPEMVYIAARAGYDYVSPRLICMNLPGERNYELHRNPQMLRETRRALQSTGVRVHDIELARILDDVDPRSYLPALEVAAELGARAVLSSIWTPRRDEAVARYAELCDLARPLGMTVNLESVPIAPVATLADAVDVLRRVDRDNAGLMIDAHHFHRTREQVQDLDSLPRRWFHFAHLCDAPAAIPAEREEMLRIMRGARLYPGEGGIDVAGIVARLPHIVFSLEIPHLERVSELGPAEHAFRCLQATKAYMAAHAARRKAQRLPQPA